MLRLAKKGLPPADIKIQRSLLNEQTDPDAPERHGRNPVLPPRYLSPNCHLLVPLLPHTPILILPRLSGLDVQMEGPARVLANERPGCRQAAGVGARRHRVKLLRGKPRTVLGSPRFQVRCLPAHPALYRGMKASVFFLLSGLTPSDRLPVRLLWQPSCRMEYQSVHEGALFAVTQVCRLRRPQL